MSVKSPPRKIYAKKELFSPDGTEATSTPSVNVLGYIDTLEEVRQDGTADYPYIQWVNQDFPERNRGVDIVMVNEIEHRGHTRDAFHIRKVVDVAHAYDWEAYLPNEQYPTLANRAIMIRGPSQDFWHQDTELYHEDNVDCLATKRQHSKVEAAILQNPERKLEHTLYIFDKSVQLENHVFSGDATNIDMEVNDMRATIKNGDDELEIMGVSVYWRVAIVGGSKLAGKAKSKKLFVGKSIKAKGRK